MNLTEKIQEEEWNEFNGYRFIIILLVFFIPVERRRTLKKQVFEKTNFDIKVFLDNGQVRKIIFSTSLSNNDKLIDLIKNLTNKVI